MIIPNKLISLEQSVLGKSRHILSRLSPAPVNVHELFSGVKDTFTDVNEFVLALDVLFSLDLIEITEIYEVYKNA